MDTDTESASETLSDPRPDPRAKIPWEDRRPPTVSQAEEALADLQNILRPRRDPTGQKHGYKKPRVDGWPLHQLNLIQNLLILYTSNGYYKGRWMPASEQAVILDGQWKKSVATPARALRKKARDFIRTRKAPENPFSRWRTSVIDDEEFQQELCLFLQTKGKYMAASDIVKFTQDPEVQKKWDINSVSLSTAKVWLNKLGYRFAKKHRGQYVDGHEREDVVQYRNSVYIPQYLSYNARTRLWTGDNMETSQLPPLKPGERLVVFWFHDESTFYAHDRREAQWVAKDACPTPYAKGEGLSMMVADFVSAEYGFLRSPDGKESARRIFRAGKS